MKILYLAFLILFSGLATAAPKTCVDYVDFLRLHHVNGMFTKYKTYSKTIIKLNEFQNIHLSSSFKSAGGVTGTYNKSDFVISQFVEVASQKLEDRANSSEVEDELYSALHKFTNGELVTVRKDILDVMVQILAEAYVEVSAGTSGLVDYQSLLAALTSQLDGCSRTVVVAHSQGNFFANIAVAELYSNYRFPGGWALSDYPMLGIMSIANPADNVGGSVSDIYNNLMGHITNNGDLVMALVQLTLGSIPANFDSGVLNGLGHGIVDDYLGLEPQAQFIANEIISIANEMTPMPLFNQHSISSSAFDSFGASRKSQILDLKFSRSGPYRYTSVPESVIDGFTNADSHGRFFNSEIRDVYPYERIE
ncbi:KTSC domain-containing protein [Ferrimonas balearica]|uniref:KTSC domain-containing protein n=1 Tax=Ferrimonas balearica TaxID=44012 RepID=UPI001F1C0623|nr:KTSC domain-containing protein [Ferrimonas balearica]MBY6017373.1 KTSC domain-containing protein [Halomonas denitrificans]MBY6093639.1 KTSC domain-containing protein [Ferrimonas balearica]